MSRTICLGLAARLSALNEFEADEFEADEFEADEFEADEFEADEFEADEFEAQGAAAPEPRINGSIPLEPVELLPPQPASSAEPIKANAPSSAH